MHEETVFLETLDGVEIEAAIIRTDADHPVATAIVAHPHPLYGGDRTNHVVRAFQQAAADLNCHSIAVNFRGVGFSGGEFDHGDSERLDLAAACELADMIEPETDIVMCGYSFGAVVALNVTHPAIKAWVAIAPPLAMMSSAPTSSSHHRQKFLFIPEHDQFSPPEDLRTLVASWAATTVTTISSVDHYMSAHALETAQKGLQQALQS